MIRPLFRVKWRLFSQTTQHVLVVSNSSKAIMILIALSDSWHRLLHFQCSDWVTQFTKVLLAEFFFSITSSARFHETKNLFKRLCTTSLLQLSMTYDSNVIECLSKKYSTSSRILENLLDFKLNSFKNSQNRLCKLISNGF